jgi:DNA-binding protein H-NS
MNPKTPIVQRFAIDLLAKASQAIPFSRRRSRMPKVSLSEMTVEALIDLRKRVDETLHKRRAELEKQLTSLTGGRRVVRGSGSALKGRKVPPKYRSRSGETWAGRGAKPRWLVAAIKGGKKLDDFLIDKSARKGRSRSKR